MSAGRRRGWSAGLGLVAVLVAVGLAGCSDSADNAGSTAAQPARGELAQPAVGGVGAPQTDRDQAAPEAPQAATGKDAPAKAPADLRVDQRSIVYTGSITVRVDNVDEAAAKAAAIVTGAGGFVGADKRSSGAGDAQATLELRVPAAKFAGVVEQLEKVTPGAKAEQRAIDTQDVTEETIDLDARIGTQQARVDSGRRLLAQAKSLSDLVMLETELAKREADLASLEAKKRRLADLTALSTITAVLLDRNAAVPAPEEPTGFLGGLAAGWNALVASLKVLLTVLGALLPWALALGVPAFGLWWLLRRTRRPGAPAAAPAAPATAPGD